MAKRQTIMAVAAGAALLIGLALIARAFLSGGNSQPTVSSESEAAFTEAAKPPPVQPAPLDPGPPPVPGSGKLLNKPG